MKLHTRIPPGIKNHFDKELAFAKLQLNQGHSSKSWEHLERAHILGQAWPIEHTRAHWHMLLFALKIKSTKEIIGQIPRLLVGGVKSFFGEIPVGNTGGADVPPLEPMEIPPDLANILRQYTH